MLEFLFDEAAGLPLLYPLKENVWFFDVFSECRNGRPAVVVKKEMLPCKIWDIFKNTSYFEEHLQRAAAKIISA